MIKHKQLFFYKIGVYDGFYTKYDNLQLIYSLNLITTSVFSNNYNN